MKQILEQLIFAVLIAPRVHLTAAQGNEAAELYMR